MIDFYKTQFCVLFILLLLCSAHNITPLSHTGLDCCFMRPEIKLGSCVREYNEDPQEDCV